MTLVVHLSATLFMFGGTVVFGLYFWMLLVMGSLLVVLYHETMALFSRSRRRQHTVPEVVVTYHPTVGRPRYVAGRKRQAAGSALVGSS
ncbi:hypothetical protein DIRU0_B12112 [Diutina rugosa]